MTPELNLPGPVAELTAACDAYEAALMTNDLDAMDALFWESPLTLRYGVGENLYGIDEIRDFRKARPGGSPQRQVIRREIVTYGEAMGTCNLEFRREGGTKTGRQSQTWLKTPDGWKVVAAHVSLMAETH
ncbi:oxalurate catabolism protein HpxZ [Mangrovicoccus sp. HB161399]|uniref:oxalurate catabolism protein HpxZ n=1 Tax=Mangrovicoccus sp. HB161399 TaxID=2720392 RepID=UPI001551B5DB|nr:oxalurate catabolism protein HpxZ [Mangrovicoccus sp. HB161399]